MKQSNKSLPIFLAFLAMGFGDAVGPMVSLAKDTFHLTNFLAQLLPFSGFIMFGILSIPMGIYQDRKGKRHVLLLGLFIAFVGLIIPIFNGMYGPVVDFSTGGQSAFFVILLSILLLGAGATILQVSGNPVMRDVSSEGKYSSNLSLAQSIKAIGSSLGFLLPPFVALAFGLDWTILFPVYAVIVLIAYLWIKNTPFQEKSADSKTASFKSSLNLLFTNGYVLLMVGSIFVYVGAEVSMSSQVPILMKETFGLDSFGLWISWSLFFLPILIGRFAGSAILRVIAPVKFLMLSVMISMVGICLLFLGDQTIAFAGIFMVGLGFANIFPLVFSITIDKMPARANELSGLMVFAIVGGALIPPITGAISDATSVLGGFMVPLVAILYIGFAAIYNQNQNKAVR